MGGDNVITYELGELITKEYGGERFKELSESLPSNHISSEWVSMIFRLYSEQPERMKQVNTGDLLAYAALQTYRMEQLDWIVDTEIDDLSDDMIRGLISPSREMYYSHTSVNSMLYRQNRLLAAAQILERAAYNMGVADSFMLRQVASMYEERAFYGMFDGTGTADRNKAAALNAGIVDSRLDWRYPYKSHAELSLYDLKSYEILASANSNNTVKSPYHALRELQIDYYQSLESYCQIIIDAYWAGKDAYQSLPEDLHQNYETVQYESLGTMVGVAAEAIVLGVGRDYILDTGKHNRYWMKQAFMRQDSMGTRVIHGDKGDVYPSIPNLTFDLQIFDYRDKNAPPINIEVKKRVGVSETSILPGIEVVTLRNGSKPHVFAQLIKDYCAGQAVAFSSDSERRSRAQQKARDYFYEAINPQRLLPDN